MGDRREQIVRAATEIAAEGGLAALTVRAVAARAGIGASTLRHYFPTQRALHQAVVDQSLDAELLDLRIGDRTVPAATRLTECLAQFLPTATDGRVELENWLALYASALGPQRTEQARRLLSGMTARALDRVDTWLATLEAEGALRHPDRLRHATVLLALIDGLCLQLLATESGAGVAEARSILAEAVERLVTVSPPD